MIINTQLPPAAVVERGEEDVGAYLSGFQGSVDEAVAQTTPGHVLDAAVPAELMAATGHDHSHSHHHEDDDHAHHHGQREEHAHDRSHDDHGHEGHGHEGHDHDHGGVDPHLWSDPARLAAVAEELAREFDRVDPDNAGTREAKAAELAGELTAVDEEFRAGLESCDHRTVVAGHAASGYLTDEYGPEQVGMAGLGPEAEFSPARLAEVGDVIRGQGVTTVFTGSQLNPKVAQALAADHGMASAVLDPAEARVDENKDYRQVMRENLEALRTGLRC